METAAPGQAKAEEWVTVGAYANGWEADLALGLLQAEGLPAHLENREFVGMDWTLAAAVGWIKVQTPADVAEAARSVLARMEQSSRAGDLHLGEADLVDAEQCLRCGGTMPVGDPVCDACGWSYGNEEPGDGDGQVFRVTEPDRPITSRQVGEWLKWVSFCLVVAVLVSLGLGWVMAKLISLGQS
ncbi:MAG: hypothetical protein AAGE65_00130 [Planctomycetota bacterium]